jgi:hypothetical protein
MQGGWTSLMAPCPHCGHWVAFANPEGQLLPEPPPEGYQIAAHDRITGSQQLITEPCLPLEMEQTQ